MNRKRIPLAAAFGLALLSILISGCKILIPAQANSDYRDAKNTNAFQIVLLDYDAAKAYRGFDFEANYKLAFGKDMETKVAGGLHPRFLIPAALLAPIASAAVGFGMNQISQSISNEAATYQAQFGDTSADDKYLKKVEEQKPNGTNYWQNYFGIEITRNIDLPKNGATNAFKLVCGICPTEDGQLFMVKPLMFETWKAKAKVVGNGPLSWIVLYPHLFMKTGSQINSVVNFSFVGYFRDRDQTLKSVPMGAFTFKFSGYDLGRPKTLSYAAKNMPKNASGFLDSAPVSYAKPADGGRPRQVNSDFAGNVELTVAVTESDASNVRENLATVANAIRQETPTVTRWATNEVDKLP